MIRTSLATLAVALLPLSAFAATCPVLNQNPDGSYTIVFPDGSSGTIDPLAQNLLLEMSGESSELESALASNLGADSRTNNVAGFRYSMDSSGQNLVVLDKIDLFIADDGTFGGSYTPQDSTSAGFAFQVKSKNPNTVICLEDESAPYLVNNPPDRLITTSDSLVLSAFSSLSSVGTDLNQCISEKDASAAQAASDVSALQFQLGELQTSVATLSAQLKSNSSKARSLRKVFRGLTDLVRRSSPRLFNSIRSRERYLDSSLRLLGKS
ncbi:MAG: hypothetical protein K1X79_10785 [Oligoflexia bacterium]|nr:hypothetical protein [Oligoflexia bacterium]